MKIKVGVIGCGLMGGIHAQCLAREKNCALVSFTNPTRAKAEALSQKFGGAIYDSVAELLEYSACDAVVIASPQQHHAAHIIAAAQAGKHILCEKPLALTRAELDEVEDAVSQSGRVFMVAHQMRFHPVVQWVRKNQPRLGKIFHLDLEWPFLIRGHTGRCFEDLRSGGFFMELGCHATDLARHLLGEVRHMEALTLRLDSRRVTEDCTHCLLQFESGAIGSILVSANFRGQRQGILIGRITGEKGRIEFSIYPYGRAFNTAKIVFDGERDVFVPDLKSETMPPNLPPSLFKDYRGFFDIYQHLNHAWLRAIRTGKEPPIPLRDGRAAVELVIAAYACQGKASDEPNRGVLAHRLDKACHPVLKS